MEGSESCGCITTGVAGGKLPFDIPGANCAVFILGKGRKTFINLSADIPLHSKGGVLMDVVFFLQQT